MRSLAAILSVIVLGFLVLITYVADVLLNEEYSQQVGESFLEYAHEVTPMIEQSLLVGEKPQVLAQWTKVISNKGGSIKLIDYPNEDKTYVIKDITITEQTDIIEIIAPLTTPQFNHQALLISFHDGFSDDEMGLMFSYTLIVLGLLSLVLTVVAWLVYRYVRRISLVTGAVASGRFDLTMPDSRIPALKQLAADINTMSSTIEDKTTDNLILTGAIHHELRIPITRIRLALDMAVGSNQDKFLQELLAGMDGDLEELSRLMEELLTISRLRLQGMAFDEEPVNVAKLVRDICSDIKVNCAALPDFKLNANYTLLERAIVNVVNNALKYAQTRVEVKANVESQRWVLSICDDGPGIPEDERDLVFKPFYRTDKSRHRTTGGFGLGLAIADMVIKESKGSIEIAQSDLGGAAFYLSWPLDK